MKSEIPDYAQRWLKLGMELYLDGKKKRAALWPKGSYHRLPPDDRLFFQEHIAEFTELVRSGQQPKLDDPPPAESAPPDPAPPCVYCSPACPYCQRPCIGRDHPLFGVFHWNDPAEAARRHEAAKRVEQQNRANWRLHGEL